MKLPPRRVIALLTCLAVLSAGCVARNTPEAGLTSSETPAEGLAAPPPSFSSKQSASDPTPTGPTTTVAASDPIAYPRGVHPYPAGDEWPADLEGPFEALPVERLRLTMSDGIELDAWIFRPDLPEGVGAPVVLAITPYTITSSWTDDGNVPTERLVSEGFAVVAVSVRGTGSSGGCLGNAPREYQDAFEVVEQVAQLPWTNGRIGMIGVSWLAMEALAAAVENPEALKTIIVAGIVIDRYTFSHSPQGAAFAGAAQFNALFSARLLTGAYLGRPDMLPERAPLLPQRACREILQEPVVLAIGAKTDDRNPAFWAARSFVSKMPNVTAAVLLGHGFLDLFGSGHAAQEDVAWELLKTAPKWMIEGQWGHSLPGGNSMEEGTVPDWDERLVAWLDFWLKGQGEKPLRLGMVDYQDQLGRWHSTTSWPPANARSEMLYLTNNQLAAAGTPREASFTAKPSEAWPHNAACGEGEGVLYITAAMTEPTLIAGNPLTALHIKSSDVGGIVGVDLFDLAPDATCTGNEWVGARRIAFGAADLRFHAGNLIGSDFPVGEPTRVRVDLTNLAEVIEPGHRLAMLVSFGAPVNENRNFEPAITVMEGPSHLVVPIVRGTLGGPLADLDAYPPRPFPGKQ